jgi:hypothetical protein
MMIYWYVCWSLHVIYCYIFDETLTYICNIINDLMLIYTDRCIATRVDVHIHISAVDSYIQHSECVICATIFEAMRLGVRNTVGVPDARECQNT